MNPAFIPRAGRIRALASRSFEKHRSLGALQAGIAAIETAFGHNRLHNDLKLAVENAMCAGPGAIRTRCDFGKLAFACPPDVDVALQTINREYLAEVRHQNQLERVLSPWANRAKERRLQQARLFLRWYRRFGDRARFPGIIDALTTSPVYAVEAAE